MAGATTVNPESLRFFAKSPRVRQDPAYNVLTEDELSRMLSAARASNYRDYVMLAVMASCGLREAEVVDSGSGTCAKRRRIRSCFASSARARKSATSRSHRTLAPVTTLRPAHRKELHLLPRLPQPLFTSRVGKDKPLTTRSVQNIVKKYVRAA